MSEYKVGLDQYIRDLGLILRRLIKSCEEMKLNVIATPSEIRFIGIKKEDYISLKILLNTPDLRIRCFTCGSMTNITLFQSAHLLDKASGGVNTILLCANCNQIQNKFDIPTVKKLYDLYN